MRVVVAVPKDNIVLVHAGCRRRRRMVQHLRRGLGLDPVGTLVFSGRTRLMRGRLFVDVHFRGRVIAGAILRRNVGGGDRRGGGVVAFVDDLVAGRRIGRGSHGARLRTKKTRNHFFLLRCVFSAVEASSANP